MASTKPKLPIEVVPKIIENLRRRKMTYRTNVHNCTNSVAEAIDMWVRWNA